MDAQDTSTPPSPPSTPKQTAFAIDRLLPFRRDRIAEFPPSSWVVPSTDGLGQGSDDLRPPARANDMTATGRDEEVTSPPPTFAQKMQAMVPTLPSISSPFSTPRPKSAPLQTAEAEMSSPLVSSPNVVNEWRLLGFLSPRTANQPLEPDRQSILSALDLFRSPRGDMQRDLPLSLQNTSTPMDCVDDNNSVMMYGPLEPDDTSEVEIACSEIVSVYEDGEEIRTPQQRFVPLPIESIEQVLMGASESSTESKGKERENSDGNSVPFIPPEERWKSPLSRNGQLPEREYRVWVPSLTKISVQTMWWGFRIYLPPPVLDVLNNKQLEAAKRAAMVTTALKWLMDHIPMPLLPPQMRPAVSILRRLVPYLGYVGGFIAWSWSAVKSFDKGYGVVLTATWLLPIALIPGTWEADDFPALHAGPQSTQTASTSRQA
ncbi:hypothetical protein ID866_6705 [Astraeus odoratus]|nr:hypothetical protein ID866_6705 [Astraeus odoratus]